MSDPISTVLIAASVGGAAGKFTELAIQQSKEWVDVYFNKHRPTAIQKAQQNTSDFLIELSNRVTQLESKGAELKDVLEDPEFSSALQKAVIASSETENKEKHQLLAEVLANRLKSETESRQALLAKMSLNIIPFLTSEQITLLKILAMFHHIHPINITECIQYEAWIKHTYFPYLDTKVDDQDIFYLESLACLKTEDPKLKFQNFPNNDPQFFRDKIKEKKTSIDLDPKFYQTPEFHKLEKLWVEHLKVAKLTSVGLFIAANTLNLEERSPIPLTIF